MTPTTVPARPRPRGAARLLRLSRLLVFPLAAWAGGCAALSNPTASEGIPVNRLPAEVLGRPRSELQPLPLTLLRQKEPDQYLLDRGDVLSVVADEVLGARGQATPVQFVQQALGQSTKAVVGYPVPVQEDGTINLPELPPLNVRGKTLIEVQKLIAATITGGPVPGSKQIVQPGKERVLVDLLQPRKYTVAVVREDSQGAGQQSTGFGVQGGDRRGAGFTISLDAYKNDLLRALNATGGPPGLNAKNEVVIRRGQYDPADPNKGFVRIPLRARPDEPITFTEQDIILNEGDTIYIEARDTEVYYTAGLVGGAQVPLPRDYDLRALQALAQIRAPLFNGSFNQTSFIGNAVQSGLGNPSPSLLTVMRVTANNQTIPIRVDLNRAISDQRENIIILPGDTLVLQERPSEAVLRYITQTYRFTLNQNPIQTANTQLTTTFTGP